MSRGGRDSIDHASGGHDDLANAVAGAADLVAFKRGNSGAGVGWYADLPNDFKPWVPKVDPAISNVAAGSAPCTLVFPTTARPLEGREEGFGPAQTWRPS